MQAVRLWLEIHRRAAAAPADVPQGVALQQAARDILGISDAEELDLGRFEALTPEAIVKIAIAYDDGYAGAAKALRSAIVRPHRN